MILPDVVWRRVMSVKPDCVSDCATKAQLRKQESIKNAHVSVGCHSDRTDVITKENWASDIACRYPALPRYSLTEKWVQVKFLILEFRLNIF
jgi:hypothetical protein